jgi:hypothetical protein
MSKIRFENDKHDPKTGQFAPKGEGTTGKSEKKKGKTFDEYVQDIIHERSGRTGERNPYNTSSLGAYPAAERRKIEAEAAKRFADNPAPDPTFEERKKFLEGKKAWEEARGQLGRARTLEHGLAAYAEVESCKDGQYSESDVNDFLEVADSDIATRLFDAAKAKKLSMMEMYMQYKKFFDDKTAKRTGKSKKITSAVGKQAYDSSETSKHREKIVNSLKAVADKLPKARAKRYHDSIHEIVTSASPRVLDIIQDNVVEYELEVSSKRYAGCVFQRQDGKQTLRMNHKLESESERSYGKIHEVLAHEYGHVIDGPNYIFSSTKEWKKIWKDEIKGKGRAAGWKYDDTGKLSRYAGSSPKEGFAEFSRGVLLGRDLSNFPQAKAFWEKEGLLSKFEKATGPLKDEHTLDEGEVEDAA